MRNIGASVALCTLLLATPAGAYQWDFDALGGFQLSTQNKISAGVQIRTEKPDKDLIGKASLPENRNLCAPDDCISVDPNDLEPNQRFLDAPGATASFTDDGDLNYPNRYDVTATLFKWLSKNTLRFGDRGFFHDLTFELGFLGFYDPLNDNFKLRHPNEITQPGPQPGESVRRPRDKQQKKILGKNLDLREANVAFRTPFFGGRELGVKIGRQLLPWGEGLLALRGSLNFVNPPVFANLLRPGFELDELYLPVNMISLDTQLTQNLSANIFYQLEWRPYGIPAKGGLVGFFDASNNVASDDVIPLPFGKTPDDPNQLGTPADNTVALVTSTSFAARRGPNIEPSDSGQFGLHLSWFTDAIGKNGLDLGFYYARYHSRIPIASATATDATCARREGNPLGIDATNVADFLAACGVDPNYATQGGRLTQRDALPLDTATFYLQYPEDIDIFGLSYNTFIGGWAWQGEVAYRPNLPVQVDIEDVLFAAFQPAFPRNTIQIVPDAVDALDPATACNNADALGILGSVCNALGGIETDLTDVLGLPTLDGAGGATLASSRRAIPDFLTGYRGGTPGEITPGQRIRGYERLNNITTSFNFTKLLGGSDAPLWADQFIFIFDFSTSWIPDLPSKKDLQFEAQGTLTHASAGINENAPIPGTNTSGPDALRINPIRTTDGFVTEFSYGYRFAALLNYKNTPWPGAQLVPLIAFFHDVGGVSPGLAANFIEGRQIIFLDLELQYGHWTANLTQNIFAGGGKNNVLRDRDNLSFSIGYEF